MDQIYQLQQQIQKLRQEVNNIQHNCQQLNNDINNMNSTAQQITHSMSQKMIQPQQLGSFSNQFAPLGTTGMSQGWSSGTMGTGNFQTQPVQYFNTPFQQQQRWAGNYYTPLQSGFNQGFGMTQGMNTPNEYSQSYAQNQRLSQQAQQDLDNRMNRATQGMFTPNYSGIF